MHIVKTAQGVVGALGLVLGIGLATPAEADDLGRNRSVVVAWTQDGELAGAAGNVHIGRLQMWVVAGETTPVHVYGEIHSYTCPDGYLPEGVGYDAMPELDANCTWEDGRVVDFEAPSSTDDVNLTVGGKLRQAHVVGTLDYNAETAPDGTMPIDLQWSATSDPVRTRTVVGTHPRVIQLTTQREAAVFGSIGTETIDPGSNRSEGEVLRYHLFRPGVPAAD